MKIVIFGFDEFGEKVSEFLGKEDISIVVFDKNEAKKAKEKYVNVVYFDRIDDNKLAKFQFDLAVCLLKNEETNLFLCLTLRDLFPNKKIIAKATNKENEYKYKLAGVDKIINPYDVTANRIITLIKKPLTIKLIEEIIFSNNTLSFAEIEVPPNSFLEDKYIKDIYKEISQTYTIIIIAIVDKEMGDNVQFVTRGINHKIDEGDILIVVGDLFDIERFKEDLVLIKKEDD